MGEITMRIGPHLAVGSEKVDKNTAQKKRGERKAGGKNEAPQGCQSHGLAKSFGVPRTLCLAAQLFGGGRDAFEEKGAEENKIVQHRVGGNRYIAAARSLSIEEHEGTKQRRIADKDVAVD